MLVAGTGLQHAAALVQVPQAPGHVLLATGGSDLAVHLYLQTPGGKFSHIADLAGHENWIRDLAFVHVQVLTRRFDVWCQSE